MKVFLIPAHAEGLASRIYAVAVAQDREDAKPSCLFHAFEEFAGADQLQAAAQVAYTKVQRLHPDLPVLLLASPEPDLHETVFYDEVRFEPRKLSPPSADQPQPRRCWPLKAQNPRSLPELNLALARAREDFVQVLQGGPGLANEGLPSPTSRKQRPKILLHVCCGPDAAGVLHQLKRDFEVLAFWYDPNIQPREEHDLRLEAFLKVAQIEEVPALVGEYDVERFLQAIKGLEHTPEKGAKCSFCYDLRLERAACEAKKQGCEFFATTLAISPHKVQEKLINFGILAERRHGVTYYHRDFKKDEGFNRSVELTREHEIYRQDYCGCLYSLHEGGPRARAQARELGLLKPSDQAVKDLS